MLEVPYRDRVTVGRQRYYKLQVTSVCVCVCVFVDILMLCTTTLLLLLV